jgi:sugar lactone lactonase YvrE
MASDPVERLLGGIDRPLSPRPEFAEALLDRLLVELERETDRIGDASDPSQMDTMSDGTERLPAFPRPGVPLPAWPGGPRRWERPLAFLATAALVVLTLMSSYLAFGPGRPGRQADNGTFLPAIRGTPATPATDEPPIAELLWQADGEPDARLGMPAGAGVDPQGNLWVTDGVNGRFVIFSPEGVTLETWGTRGNGVGEFDFRCSGEGYGGVAFDTAGNIYVADAGNGRIQKFGPDRTFLTSWPSEGITVENQLLVTGRGNTSLPNPQSLCPVAVAVDGRGRVVVSERNTGTIQVFAADGRPLATATTEGMRPEGVAVDGAGNIWVADTTDRVLKFSPDGTLLAAWDATSRDAGELNSPMGIAVDGQGLVYVSDQGSRIQVFASDGQFLGAWGSPGLDAGDFVDPVALTLDGGGHLYAIEHFGRVQKFRLLPPLGPG